MTDPVGPLSRSLEVLRRQIAERARQLDTGNRSTGTSSSYSSSSASTSGKGNVGELRQRIADRLKGIDPQSPNADRKRRRVFLESTLAWEFGEEVLRDPSFQEILDRLESSLTSHPEMEQQLEAMFKKNEG